MGKGKYTGMTNLKDKRHITTVQRDYTLEQVLEQYSILIHPNTPKTTTQMAKLILADCPLPAIYATNDGKFLVEHDWLKGLYGFCRQGWTLRDNVTFWALPDRLQDKILSAPIVVHEINVECSNGALIDQLADMLDSPLDMFKPGTPGNNPGRP